MCRHAEAHRDGLEILLLFVDRVSAAPPPGLMDEWPVGGIHQPDDAVVYRCRHFSGEMGQGVFVGKSWHPWRRRDAADLRLSSLPGGGAGRHEYPEKSVAFLARECARVDAIHFQLGIFGKRRDLAALSALRLEAPTVVAALHLLAIEASVGERNTSVRAAVAHGEGRAIAFASDHQRRTEQHRRVHRLSADCARSQRAIPEAVKPVGGWLSLCGARHGDDLNTVPDPLVSCRTRLFANQRSTWIHVSGFLPSLFLWDYFP